MISVTCQRLIYILYSEYENAIGRTSTPFKENKSDVKDPAQPIMKIKKI